MLHDIYWYIIIYIYIYRYIYNIDIERERLIYIDKLINERKSDKVQ